MESPAKPARSTRVPEPYGTVCPWVITRDTHRLIEFLTEAFGGVEIDRVVNEDGSIGHAEVFVGESVVLAFDSRPHWPVTPAYLRIYVDDADATFERALRAGAETVTMLGDTPWGDRAGRIRDPLGNIWWVMARMEQVSAEELARRWVEPKWVAALEHASDFDAFPTAKGRPSKRG